MAADPLRFVTSVLAPEAVREVVGSAYGREVVGCRLVRSLVNDVYVVESAAGRYAFKLYRTVVAARAHSVNEVAWEQELALELVAAGLEVPAPVALTDGSLVGQLDAPEGPRAYTLTSWVAGTKPQPPFTDDLYRAFGSLTARFHTVAARFRNAYERRPLDPLDRLGETAVEVAGCLTDPAERALVLGRADVAARRLSGLASGLTSGVRHGDVTLDNLHLTGTRMALHDFDRSGPGWLVADLTGVSATEHWSAFLAGYRDVRPLGDAELEALPWLRVADLVTNLRFHLVDKPMMRGTESVGEGWAERELGSLRELESRFPG